MASQTPSNPNRFTPTEPPVGTIDDLRRYFYEEFQKLSALVNMLADGQIEKTYAAPTKLRDGMIRFADGTSWNPGAGRGVYYYDLTSTSWKLLG